MDENEKQFIAELAALLNKYGLTIEQHTYYDDGDYSETWSFESETTDLDLGDVVDVLRKENRRKSIEVDRERFSRMPAEELREKLLSENPFIDDSVDDIRADRGRYISELLLYTHRPDPE